MAEPRDKMNAKFMPALYNVTGHGKCTNCRRNKLVLTPAIYRGCDFLLCKMCLKLLRRKILKNGGRIL